MEQDYRFTQLINGEGIFNANGLDSFVKEVKLADCGVSYVVVAMMGPQSSGKSTLLNHLFRTKFTEMNAIKGRKQTTEGIWMANCVGIEPCTIVLDLEGNDGRERADKDDTSFEKKIALFALAISDIMMINMWCHDIGRDLGSNIPLLKTVFQAMMHLFVPGRKTVLLFVIRDISLTPLEMLKTDILDGLRKIWDEVVKEQDHINKNTPYDDIFKVEVVGLPHYTFQKPKFEEEVASLRKDYFSNSTSPGGLVGDRRNVVAASGFSFSANILWEQIKEEKSLDLPSHKVMVANVRCEDIANHKFNQLISNQDWLELEEAVKLGPVEGFGEKLSAILETCFSDYEKEARYFDDGVKKKRRDLLEKRAFNFVYPSYSTMVEHIRSSAFEHFKVSLQLSINNGEDILLSSRVSTQSSIAVFDHGLADAAIKQTVNWDVLRIRDALCSDMEAHTQSMYHEKIVADLIKLNTKNKVGWQTSLWRGCVANFPQPVNDDVQRDAQHLLNHVYHSNGGTNIEYRSCTREEDILHRVFRWDLTPYQEVFQNGFKTSRQHDTPDEVYFNLDHYAHHGGTPLESRRPATHSFVSTTLYSAWHPRVTETVNEIYRYEIYAPGGIWIAETLGDRYRYKNQDEICFVAGIAPQYIRSAQCFRLIAGSYQTRYTRRERVDNVITINGNYNPQSHPPECLRIRRPIFDYLNENGMRVPLKIRIWPVPAISESNQQETREANSNSRAIDWYAGDVANSESYIINAAFRSCRRNEAYIFMANEYVLLDYAPSTTNDKVLNGPLLICDGYPSLTGTAFAEHGIDCAFGSHNWDEAFIFSGNLCAQINYAPHTTNDKIIKGPMTITSMFPFLKGTVFKSGVDAAFESSIRYEAYLFKDDQYALINYGSGHGCLIHVQLIVEGFPSLSGTIFATGFDTAFASSWWNEAYLFKGDSYARINFAPHSTNDYIKGGVKKIFPNWPSLKSILPRNNRGLDIPNHTAPDVDDNVRP